MGWCPELSREQWVVVASLGSVNFANTLCASLQAPFYPQEAEKKGATAAEYGLVFGIYELVAFISCPIFGKYVGKCGSKLMLNGGLAIAGLSCMCFGMLTLVTSRVEFISFSFLIRITESLGAAAAMTASFSITATVFPNSVAVMFAFMEIFFGLGFIVGPTIGGFLYQLGGFMAPFLSVGSTLLLIAVASFCSLPDIDNANHVRRPPGQILSVLKLPSVMLAVYSVVSSTISMGYYEAILEPHLRQFNLSPLSVGGMFVIMGGTYTVSSPIVGWLCDKKVNPKQMTLIGCLLAIGSYLLVGPAPIMPFKTTFWVVCVGLFLEGVGYSCLLVSSFIDGMSSAITHGLPDDITTYGVVSGLMGSAFCLGGFIGPSVAGYLYTTVGFEWGSFFVLAVIGVLLLSLVWDLCRRRRPTDSTVVYHVPVENIATPPTPTEDTPTC